MKVCDIVIGAVEVVGVQGMELVGKVPAIVVDGKGPSSVVADKLPDGIVDIVPTVVPPSIDVIVGKVPAGFVVVGKVPAMVVLVGKVPAVVGNVPAVGKVPVKGIKPVVGTVPAVVGKVPLVINGVTKGVGVVGTGTEQSEPDQPLSHWQ